jgi:hypothetical protein
MPFVDSLCYKYVGHCLLPEVIQYTRTFRSFVAANNEIIGKDVYRSPFNERGTFNALKFLGFNDDDISSQGLLSCNAV